MRCVVRLQGSDNGVKVEYQAVGAGSHWDKERICSSECHSGSWSQVSATFFNQSVCFVLRSVLAFYKSAPGDCPPSVGLLETLVRIHVQACAARYAVRISSLPTVQT